MCVQLSVGGESTLQPVAYKTLTGAQFQGPSSPQLHIAYTTSLPVDWSALDIFAKRSYESRLYPARPSL